MVEPRTLASGVLRRKDWGPDGRSTQDYLKPLEIYDRIKIDSFIVFTAHDSI